jgi:hypothetical protein
MVMSAAPDRRRAANRARFSRALDRELRRDLHRAGAAGADLTRSIMGRLGYMRASPRVLRRDHLRRWTSRLGTLAAAAVALIVAVHGHNSSTNARRTIGPTIPAAVTNELREQRERLESVFQLLRHLPRTEAESSAVEDAADRPAVDAPAAAPVGEWMVLDPFQWV